MLSRIAWKKPSVIPGFGLTLGLTMLYLSLMVLIPLSALVIKAFSLSWHDIIAAVWSPRVIESYKLTFGTSLVAASINTVFGLLVAWVLVRYRFPGKRLVDAMVDLPFALPTAVAGIALTTIYAEHGVVGQWLPFKVAYTPLGITVALTFISLPFVVRTVQPVLEDLSSKEGRELEEAATCLGAGRWGVIRRIILPEIWPALVTGFALAFARAVGEYGSVVFISSNLPFKTEVTPLLIFRQLEDYHYAEAAAIAVVMLGISLVVLIAINVFQRWLATRGAYA